MPIYNFACDDCNIYWDVEGHMSDPPQPEDNPCPECSGASYRSFTPIVTHFHGTGFQTNISKVEEFHRKGLSKDDALEFYNTSIKHTKERIEDGAKAYTPMCIDLEKALAKGDVKKVDDKKAKEKASTAKDLNQYFTKRTKKE